MVVQLVRFAEMLKEERCQRGWSQRRIAEELGTDSVTISRWERGITQPSPYFREKLCLLFDKSASYLGLLEEFVREEMIREEPMMEAYISGESIKIEEDETQEIATADDRMQEAITEDPMPAIRIAPSVPAITRQERILACTSYLFWWVSGFILWWANGHSPFVRLHARKSMQLFGGLSVLLAFLALGRWSLLFLLISQRQPFVRRTIGAPRPYATSLMLHIVELRLIPLLAGAFSLVLLCAGLCWIVALWQAARGRSHVSPWRA